VSANANTFPTSLLAHCPDSTKRRKGPYLIYHAVADLLDCLGTANQQTSNDFRVALKPSVLKLLLVSLARQPGRLQD
jgi:hypothetical protein